MSEHAHSHTHKHDEDCACGHCHTETPVPADKEAFGAIHVESHLHDDARVISGHLKLRGDETRVKAELQAQLKNMARAVAAFGGIVGHIKASCETTVVDMFSVTDVEVSSKRSPESVLRINLAAIVFAIDPEDTENMVEYALKTVRDSAN